MAAEILFALASSVGFGVACRMILERQSECCSWGEERRVNIVAAFGAAGYAAIFATGTLALGGGWETWATLAIGLAGFAVAASVALTAYQYHLITKGHRANWCGWCLASAACAVITFLSLLLALNV